MNASFYRQGSWAQRACQGDMASKGGALALDPQPDSEAELSLLPPTLLMTQPFRDSELSWNSALKEALPTGKQVVRQCELWGPPARGSLTAPQAATRRCAAGTGQTTGLSH